MKTRTNQMRVRPNSACMEKPHRLRCRFCVLASLAVLGVTFYSVRAAARTVYGVSTTRHTTVVATPLPVVVTPAPRAVVVAPAPRAVVVAPAPVVVRLPAGYIAVLPTGYRAVMVGGLVITMWVAFIIGRSSIRAARSTCVCACEQALMR